MDEGDERLSLVHHVHFMLAQGLVHQGFLDLENDLCAVIYLLRIVNHLCAGADIILIVIEGAVSGMALHEHLKTVLDKFTHRLGGCSYTSLVVHDLFGNTKNHSVLCY